MQHHRGLTKVQLVSLSWRNTLPLECILNHKVFRLLHGMAIGLPNHRNVLEQCAHNNKPNNRFHPE